MTDHPYDRDVDAAALEAHRARQAREADRATIRKLSLTGAAPELRASKCRSCGGPILWTLTATGSRMPVDFAPVAGGGDVAIVPGRDDDGRPVWRSTKAGPLEDVEGASRVRRLSHFATCPDARKWRGKR